MTELNQEALNITKKLYGFGDTEADIDEVLEDMFPDLTEAARRVLHYTATYILEHGEYPPDLTNVGKAEDQLLADNYRVMYSAQVLKLLLAGYDNRFIADFFGVTPQILQEWRVTHPVFNQNWIRGETMANGEVAHALFGRAVGSFAVTKTKFATHEGQISDSREYTEQLAPDIAAQRFWLTNRKQDSWGERSHVSQTVRVTEDLTDDELKKKLETAGLMEAPSHLSSLESEDIKDVL